MEYPPYVPSQVKRERRILPFSQKLPILPAQFMLPSDPRMVQRRNSDPELESNLGKRLVPNVSYAMNEDKGQLAQMIPASKKRRKNDGVHKLYDVNVSEKEYIIPQSQKQVLPSQPSQQSQQPAQLPLPNLLGLKKMPRLKDPKPQKYNPALARAQIQKKNPEVAIKYPRILGDNGAEKWNNPHSLIESWKDYLQVSQKQNLPKTGRLSKDYWYKQLRADIKELIDYEHYEKTKYRGPNDPPYVPQQINPLLFAYIFSSLGAKNTKQAFRDLPEEQWKPAWKNANKIMNIPDRISQAQSQVASQPQSQQPPQLTQAMTTQDTQPPDDIQMQEQNLTQTQIMPPSINQTQAPSTYESEPSGSQTFSEHNVQPRNLSAMSIPPVEQQSQQTNPSQQYNDLIDLGNGNYIDLDVDELPDYVQQQSQQTNPSQQAQPFLNQISQQPSSIQLPTQETIISQPSSYDVLTEAQMQSQMQPSSIQQPTQETTASQIAENMSFPIRNFSSMSAPASININASQVPSINKPIPTQLDIDQISKDVNSYSSFPATLETTSIDDIEMKDEKLDYDPDSAKVKDNTQSTGQTTVANTEQDSGISIQPNTGQTTQTATQLYTQNPQSGQTTQTDTQRYTAPPQSGQTTQTDIQPMGTNNSDDDILMDIDAKPTPGNVYPNQYQQHIQQQQQQQIQPPPQQQQAPIASIASTQNSDNDVIMQMDAKPTNQLNLSGNPYSQGLNPTQTVPYTAYISQPSGYASSDFSQNTGSTGQTSSSSQVSSNQSSSPASSTQSSIPSLGSTQLLSKQDYPYDYEANQAITPILPTIALEDPQQFYKQFIEGRPTNIDDFPRDGSANSYANWLLSVGDQLNKYRKYAEYKETNGEDKPTISAENIRSLLQIMGLSRVKGLFESAHLLKEFGPRIEWVYDNMSNLNVGNDDEKQETTDVAMNQPPPTQNLMPPLERKTDMTELPDDTKIKTDDVKPDAITDIDMKPSEEELKEQEEAAKQIKIQNQLKSLQKTANEMGKVWRKLEGSLTHQYPQIDFTNKSDIANFFNGYKTKIESGEATDENLSQYMQPFAELGRLTLEAVQEEIHRLENLDPKQASSVDLKMLEVLKQKNVKTHLVFPNASLYDSPAELLNPEAVKNKYKEYLQSELAETYNGLGLFEKNKQAHEKRRNELIQEYEQYSGRKLTPTMLELKSNRNLEEEVQQYKTNLESNIYKDAVKTNEKLWRLIPENKEQEERGITKDNFDRAVKARANNEESGFKSLIKRWQEVNRKAVGEAINNELKIQENKAKENGTFDIFNDKRTKWDPHHNDSLDTLLNKLDYWRNFETQKEVVFNAEENKKERDLREQLQLEHQKLTGKRFDFKAIGKEFTTKQNKERNDYIRRSMETYKQHDERAKEAEDRLRKYYDTIKDTLNKPLGHDKFSKEQYDQINDLKIDPNVIISKGKTAKPYDPDSRAQDLNEYLIKLRDTHNLITATEKTADDQELTELQDKYDNENNMIGKYRRDFERLENSIRNKPIKDARQAVIDLQNLHEKAKQDHTKVFQDVIALKHSLQKTNNYEEKHSEDQLFEMPIEDLEKLKLVLQTKENKLKTNMGTYGKANMINNISKIQNQMKAMDPNSVPLDMDQKYLETLDEDKVRELLYKDLNKKSDLEEKRNKIVEGILDDVDKIWVNKRILQKENRFQDYEIIKPGEILKIDNIKDLQQQAHQIHAHRMEGDRYAEDILEEHAAKNKANIQNQQKELQQQHERNMEQGRQSFANLQADRDRNNRTYNAILHTMDTTANNALKTWQTVSDTTYKTNRDKVQNRMNLFLENKKHLLHQQDLQNQQARHAIDTNLKKEEIELKHEDNLVSNFLKQEMQESNHTFQQNLQKSKLDQEKAEAKLERDLKQDLNKTNNELDLFKTLADYDLKGRVIIKNRGLEDRKTLQSKQLGDVAMTRVKNLMDRNILDKEHNHAKQILNIQQQFQGRQADNEQTLKQIMHEEKIELDKYINKQVLKSKRQLQSGEHRFKLHQYNIEKQDADEETQKKIKATENFIDTVVPDLEELKVPYIYPTDMVSKEDADNQAKYFRELKESLREIPAERKKLELLAKRVDKIPQDLKDELDVYIPHRDDINKMDYKRIQEVKKHLQDALQNNKIDELELNKQRDHALKLNKYIDDINSMTGDKVYENIGLRNAPKDVDELDIAERRLKEKYETVRQDLRNANTAKASLYTEIEEIRKELSPSAKHLIPKLTEYKSFETQKNNLFSGNLELVNKQVAELSKILRQAYHAKDYDTRGKHAENTLDTYMSGLRTIAGDSTTFYKILQNAAHGQEVNKGLSVDPIKAKQLIDQSRNMFEMVASNSFLQNVGRKNEHEIGLIIDSAKQMYEHTGLSKELGTKWEDVEYALNNESPLRKSATVEMLAKSQPLSEMYLVNLAVDLKANTGGISQENPVKLYTAMKSMGIDVDMNKVKGQTAGDINRQLLQQIPPHLLGDAAAKRIASEEELNHASWLRQSKTTDQFSENWVQQNMITGDTAQEAVKRIQAAPGYRNGAPISKLDFATGNFYPVNGIKGVKGHEAYFLNKPADLRSLSALKKDRIMHEANALMGPFGLAYGNDKRRRAMLPLANKTNYVHLAKFLNALPQSKTFLNNKEKLLSMLHGKKRREIPDKAKVKHHFKKRRKARLIRKKLKRKLKKRIKDPEKGGGLEDDTSDDGGVFDYDSEVDIFKER